MVSSKCVTGCSLLTTSKRCTGNRVLDQLLWTYGKVFGDDIVVVITHIDDTGGSDDTMAQGLQEKGEDLGDYFVLAQGVRDLETKIAGAKGHIGRVARKRAKPKSGSESERLKSIMKDNREELKDLMNRRFEDLVGARSQNVIRTMQQTRAQYMHRDVTLKVCCISNTHHQRLCQSNALEPGLQSMRRIQEFVLCAHTFVCSQPQPN